MTEDNPYMHRGPNPDSHHTKILAFESAIDPKGNRYGLVAFGSGNFNLGSLAINVEDWTILSSKVRSATSFWWECTFSYLANLAESYGNGAAKAFDICRGDKDPLDLQLVDGSRLLFFLHPMDADPFLDAFRKEIELAKEVIVLAPSFETRAVRSMIRDNPHTKFTILVDDAFVLASELGETLNFISPATANELLSYADQVENVDLKFLQTNHNYHFHKYGNTLHARSVLFIRPSGEKVYLSSSSHFKDGSYFTNIEQSMLIYGISADLQSSFVYDPLQRSITRDEVVIWNPPGSE